jgi:23S rRNA pseudouridine2605 synthase
MGDKIYAQLPTQLQQLKQSMKRVALKPHELLPSPQSSGRLLPVERLDFDTEGLCLVTNNGAFARFLASPTLGLKRSYRVRVHGRITEEKLGGLKRGVHVPAEVSKASTSNTALRKTLPLQVSVDTLPRGASSGTNCWLTISASEPNRQRNLQAALGKLFIRPTRVISTAFGPFRLPIDSNTGRISIPSGGLVEAKIPADLLAKWIGGGFRAPSSTLSSQTTLPQATITTSSSLGKSDRIQKNKGSKNSNF